MSDQHLFGAILTDRNISKLPFFQKGFLNSQANAAIKNPDSTGNRDFCKVG
jgi:hypothetical protein